MKKEVLKIKAKLLRHFHAWLLTSSLSCTLDFLAYFYQMKLMVAARVTLCGYSSGSEQALSACFLCGFPPRSAFPPLRALRNSVLDFCYASVVNAACSDGQGLKPPRSARLAHQPLLCLPLFLSYPCCLWWAKYRSLTPRPGLGFFFCFNMEKAQNSSPRTDNVGCGKKLFIDGIKSDLKQQYLSCLEPTPSPFKGIMQKVGPENKGWWSFLHCGD